MSWLSQLPHVILPHPLCNKVLLLCHPLPFSCSNRTICKDPGPINVTLCFIQLHFFQALCLELRGKKYVWIKALNEIVDGT